MARKKRKRRLGAILDRSDMERAQQEAVDSCLSHFKGDEAKQSVCIDGVVYGTRALWNVHQRKGQ